MLTVYLVLFCPLPSLMAIVPSSSSSFPPASVRVIAPSFPRKREGSKLSWAGMRSLNVQVIGDRTSGVSNVELRVVRW